MPGGEVHDHCLAVDDLGHDVRGIHFQLWLQCGRARTGCSGRGWTGNFRADLYPKLRQRQLVAGDWLKACSDVRKPLT